MSVVERSAQAARRIVKRLWPAAPERYLQLRMAAYSLPRKVLPPAVSDVLDLRRRRFEKAYASGRWSSTGESLSGDGSSLEATAQLRRALPPVLRELQVRTLLDVPCGDCNWMSLLDLDVDRYIGADLVPSVVEGSRRRFGGENREFRVLDLCVDPLPEADLLLCRDALVHFSYADVWRALENIARSSVRYLATTTFPGTGRNTDIATGVHWRHLNLEIAPFDFPPARRTLPEGYNRPDQVLAVWSVDDVRAVVSGRR